MCAPRERLGGLELQALALAQHDEPSQRAFMMDDNVQALLGHVHSVLLLHSLDAERKAAEVKLREDRNISLLSNVSRELLCRRFTMQREKMAKPIEDAAQQLRKLMRSSWNARAWDMTQP